MSKRAQVYFNRAITESLGTVLRDNRLHKGYSLGDIADMTGFPKSTIIKIEKGEASNIHYYVAYGQSVKISILDPFIKFELKPRFELSPAKLKRTRLTLKIRELYFSGLFTQSTTVKETIAELRTKYKLEDTGSLSVNVSRVLLNLVEDGLLKKAIVNGKKNAYQQL